MAVENPNFYVVSPCFAIAKVWKDAGSDTVFIDVDKTGKCDVSGCEQQLTDSIDTPNYCYASEEFIWGNNDAPSLAVYLGEYIFCRATCEAITTTPGSPFCASSCKYTSIAQLLIEATGATEAYRNPSWQRQETGWGYWNYQKAEDVCDLIDMISGWRVKATTLTEAQEEVKKITDLTSIKQKVNAFMSASYTAKAKYLGSNLFDINDVCYATLLIGDTSLAWPIKTPAGELWRKAAILGQDCMRDSASQCAWIRKCVVDDDCPDGYVCDITVGECIVGVT